MKRKYNFSIKLYDLNSCVLETCFDLHEIFFASQYTIFASKSYSKLYFCMEKKFIKDGINYSRFYLLGKLKVGKNLDLVNFYILVSNQFGIKFQINQLNYNKLVEKLNRKKA